MGFVGWIPLLHINQRPIFVYVTGNCDENEETCFVSMVDVTIRRSQELLTQARLGLLQMAETSSLDDFLEETLNQAEKLTGSTIGFCHFVEADQITLRLQNWSTRTKKDYCRAKGKGMHYGLDKAGVHKQGVGADSDIAAVACHTFDGCGDLGIV